MQDADTSISQRVTSLAASSVPETRIPSAVCSTWDPLGVSRLSMTLHSIYPWEVAAGIVVLSALAALGLWLVFRKRPTPEELERARRQFLVQSGRIVDGMLLDVCEVAAEDSRWIVANKRTSGGVRKYARGSVWYLRIQRQESLPLYPLDCRRIPQRGCGAYEGSSAQN